LLVTAKSISLDPHTIVNESLMQVHISPVFLAIDAGPSHLHSHSMKQTCTSLSYSLTQVRVAVLTPCIGEWVSGRWFGAMTYDEAPLTKSVSRHGCISSKSDARAGLTAKVVCFYFEYLAIRSLLWLLVGNDNIEWCKARMASHAIPVSR
jgi:hypothetical protein